MFVSLGIVFSGLAFLLLFILFLSSFYRVRQAEAMIIERFGRYNRTLGPGLHVLIPFVDEARRVVWTQVKEMEGDRFYRFLKKIQRIDLREAVYDFPKQSVITRDNVTTEINALVYYRIIDPYAAVYGVYDLPEAIEKLAQTTLRNVIGSMDLDEMLVSRDQVNTRLRQTLDEAADKWGVDVTRVELQEVRPPADIRQAMEKQMRAERDRRAVILEAEGFKQAAILRAEGDQEARVREARGASEAKIIMAEGESDARLRTAHAEAQALELIARAMPNKDAGAYLVAIQYIRTLPQLTEGKDNKLIVVPYEATALLGSLAGIKEIFDHLQK